MQTSSRQFRKMEGMCVKFEFVSSSVLQFFLGCWCPVALLWPQLYFCNRTLSVAFFPVSVSMFAVFTGTRCCCVLPLAAFGFFPSERSAFIFSHCSRVSPARKMSDAPGPFTGLGALIAKAAQGPGGDEGNRCSGDHLVLGSEEHNELIDADECPNHKQLPRQCCTRMI